MPSDEEIVNLIKSAAKAKEYQFDKMSIEELESLYQQGSALSNNKSFFKDLYLFEGVNQRTKLKNGRINNPQHLIL